MQKNKLKANLYSHMAETYINRFFELNNIELLTSAVELYFQAIRLDPDSVDSYIGLSYLELNYGNPENAWKLINKAKMIEPTNIRVNNIREKMKKTFLNKK